MRACKTEKKRVSSQLEYYVVRLIVLWQLAALVSPASQSESASFRVKKIHAKIRGGAVVGFLTDFPP